MLFQFTPLDQFAVFARPVDHFSSGSPVVNTTVSMGKRSGRKCVLKKCTVKMNPTASSASSL